MPITAALDSAYVYTDDSGGGRPTFQSHSSDSVLNPDLPPFVPALIETIIPFPVCAPLVLILVVEAGVGRGFS